MQSFFSIRTLLGVSFLALSLSLTACSGVDKKKISAIDIPLTAHDFYKDFAAVDTNNLVAGMQTLEQKYPKFLRFFLKELVALNVDSGYQSTALHSFKTYPDYTKLFDTVNAHFPKTNKYTAQIKLLLQHIDFYTDSISLPTQLYYYAAGLHAAGATVDSSLAIGLDMFLGAEFEPYRSVGISQYESQWFVPQQIEVAAAKVLYQNRYGTDFENKQLLELMISEGKQLLFLHTVLPERAEEDILQFTKSQATWCQDNELTIYQFFISQNLLYERSGLKTLRYINAAPTSTGMPPESPGRTAVFIGYQIMKAYQDKTGKSLQEVLNENDAQKILTQSNYKPKNK